ncbi:type II toxin-antitoxin system VapC family toxin [Pelagibacterium sediminicola]|uniref:type II toxin-antitoxin system VapC family toxin n=1 Tax=Pelagibacterium sediminicola TaxID=2248761 RepID=UPI000E30F966|nr:type II toxin-antitoxin system VapC family toxin [Pelagibacterium sediminicola]
MKYLLDTNAIIALLKGNSVLVARIKAHRPDAFGVSSIVMHELYYGAYKSRRLDANLERVEALRFETVDFDAEDARVAGQIRAQLASAGMPVGPYDVLIAGQAMARSLRLISRNMREFSRINGLAVEDWETAPD